MSSAPSHAPFCGVAAGVTPSRIQHGMDRQLQGDVPVPAIPMPRTSYRSKATSWLASLKTSSMIRRVPATRTNSASGISPPQTGIAVSFAAFIAPVLAKTLTHPGAW